MRKWSKKMWFLSIPDWPDGGITEKHQWSPELIWGKNVTERVKLRWHPTLIDQQVPKDVFWQVTAVTFVSAERLFCTASSHRWFLCRQPEKQQHHWRKEKHLKKKECALWVQAEGKLRQAKPKLVLWMHGCLNYCWGLWSHWKTGFREQEHLQPNQGYK